MRKLLGFLLLVLLICLCLNGLVVSNAEETDVPAPLLSHRTYFLPLTPADYTQKTENTQTENTKISVIPPVLSPYSVQISKDANGTPLQNITYFKANYMAFHLSDSAG